MSPSLQTLRATASFSPWWHLVPLALSGAALIVACVVHALVGTDINGNAAAEVPVAAPTQPDAHGA